MDKVINEANAEIENLSQRISCELHQVELSSSSADLQAAMQMEQDQLRVENVNLANAYREKNKKHQHTQELYDRLKRKEMTAATQSAAYDSANEVLGSATRRQTQGRVDPTSNGVNMRSETRDAATFAPFTSANEQTHYSIQRGVNHGSNGSGRMMPPPAPLQHQDCGNPTSASRELEVSFCCIQKLTGSRQALI